MIADIMTKGSGKIQFLKLRNISGLKNDCKRAGVLEIDIIVRNI